MVPPFTEPVGVEVDVEGSVKAAAFFFAAFSARRFCFDAEGGMKELGRSNVIKFR